MNDQEFDLRRMLGVLRRQWRLIVLTAILVMGLASLAIFSLKPAYTASTLVLFNPGSTNLLNPTTTVMNSASESSRVDSEVEIVTAETTLLTLIENLKLLEDPEFAVQRGLREQLMILLRLAEATEPTREERIGAALSRLQESVRVFRNGLTFLITISATADDPQSSARIANGLANTYIRAQIESKIASRQSALGILEERAAQASAAVAQSEVALSDFITASVDRVVAETGRTDLDQLRAELEELSSQRDDLAASVQAAQSGLAAQDWQSVIGALQSETLTSLYEQHEQLQTRLVAAIDGSQEATDLRNQLSSLATQLRTGAEQEISRLQTEVSSVQAVATDLQVQLRSLLLNTDLPPDVVTELYGLQQNAELARSQYQTMLTRISDLEAESYLQVADSRVVSAATPSDEPSFPDTRLMISAAAILSLMLGVIAANLRENFIGGFVNDTQLASVLKTPVVAAIPKEKALKPRGNGDGQMFSHADLLVQAPFSSFSESIRRLQVGVDLALRRSGTSRRRSGAAAILVTSSNASEGKTTTSLALTRAYALSGKRTLLIDCDLRKPSVHQHLGLAPSPRFHEHLADMEGEADLEPSMVTDSVTKAKIVYGGRPSDAATQQVITSEHFGRLIEVARKDFDVVILDAPPVGAVVDAVYLAQFADVIVAITRYGSTSQHDAHATINALIEAKRDDAEIVSVLSAVEQSRSAAKRKYGPYYQQV